MSILDSIHELWSIVGEVWDCGDIAGNSGVLRDHARHWRTMQADLNSLIVDLDANVTHNLVGGRDGNWNDRAGENFQKVWTQTKQQTQSLAREFGQVADDLDAFASQVDSFNDNFHQCLIVIAASLAVMAATTWIPFVDIGTDGLALAADAEEVDQAWNLINTLKSVLLFLRSNLIKNFVFNLAKNFLINFTINWGSRLVERGIMLGDPTEGWSPYDRNQLLILTGLSTLPSMIIPVTPLGKWAALPTTRATSFATLPWGQFLKSSALRFGQTMILANAYNLSNHIFVKGQGFDFDIGSTLGFGSVSTGAPTLLIIAGNAVWFMASGGTKGLPQGLTMPTLVAVNTVADVGIPGLSAQVREARGLVYVTVGGHLPAPVIQVMQSETGMVGTLPTHIVKPGETLWDIAVQQYGQNAGLEYAAIAKRNHITNPALIRPGQVLVLPPVPAAA